MSGTLQGTHNLTLTPVTIDGIPITGAADGDFVVIDYNAPIYNTTVGGDGDYHRATSNDQGGTCVIRVMQTSIAARVALDNIIRLHEQGLAPTHTIAVRSLTTGEHIVLTQAYPEERPSHTFAQETSVREYQFRSPRINKIG